MKRIITRLLKGNLGKKRMQGFYETLFRLALKGMNYGNGGDFKESGELNVLNYIQNKFKHEKSFTLFDVGANIGNYSKVLADFFGKTAIVHAFEPSSFTFEKLRENTAGRSGIITNNFGFSDYDDKVLLYTNKEASGLASVYQRNLAQMSISMEKSEEILLFTADNYCLENNINRIHLLKIDVEGHELNVLKGAAKLLSDGAVEFIQFEFGGTNIDSKTYFRDFYNLLKDRYRLYRIVKDGLYEVKQYKITQEVFVSTNYLAEKM